MSESVFAAACCAARPSAARRQIGQPARLARQWFLGWPKRCKFVLKLDATRVVDDQPVLFKCGVNRIGRGRAAL